MKRLLEKSPAVTASLHAVQTPNRPGVVDRTQWNLKATASYDGPWGVRRSTVLRHQSGSNYARTISIPNSTGLITSAIEAGRRPSLSMGRRSLTITRPGLRSTLPVSRLQLYATSDR